MPFKKNEVNKEKILNSALTVFCQSGYKGSTIIDIAKKAKVNKALVYYYFQDKEFVFQNVIRKNLKNIIIDFRNFLKDIDEHPLPIEVLIGIVRKIKNKYKLFFQLLIAELLKEEDNDIANLIIEVLSKEEVNFQSELNKILADSGISTEVSLYNREVLVLFLGLLSADIITEKLAPLLLNTKSSQLELFQGNIDRLISGLRFKSN